MYFSVSTQVDVTMKGRRKFKKNKSKPFLTEGAKRKANRKQLRKLKKVARHAFSSKDKKEEYSKVQIMRNNLKERLTKKERVSNLLQAVKEKKKFEEVPPKNVLPNEAKRNTKSCGSEELGSYLEKSKLVRKQIMKEENKKEDANIKQLEKKLGMNRNKKDKLPSWVKHDGLDYILDTCDKEKLLSLQNTIFSENVSDTGEKDDEMEEKNDAMSSTVNSDDDEMEEINDALSSTINSDDDESLSNESDDIDDFGGDAVKCNGSVPDENKSDLSNAEYSDTDQDECKEDIYGRLRDKKGNIIEKSGFYVPPKMRESLMSPGEENTRLLRQVKGLMNRLAESNLVPICNEIESLYRNNSRHVMNDTILKTICDLTLQTSLTPERIVREVTMAIAILHGNIGVEIGSYMMEKLALKFSSLVKTELEEENKILDNMISLFVFLYCFKVIHSVFIFDLLDIFTLNMSDKNISLILCILQNSGFLLRKDDPLKLKEYIIKTQKIVGEKVAAVDKLRVKFMLEILMSIKNNNMHKIPQYDPSKLDHPRKLVRSSIRGNYGTSLKLTLEDLLQVNTKGRWWIVGSAWEGTASENKVASTKEKDHEDISDSKVVELAQKQMMNTPIRRKIFAILISAEDFEDAFEKLLHLNLKQHSEQEIIHVIVACCLQERIFNPFYACVAARFLHYHRRFLMTLQCNLWDKFKDMNSFESYQMKNLANFIAYLVLDVCLPITVLKVIEFSDMDKTLAKFLNILLKNILLEGSEETLSAIFTKLTLSDKLRRFKESIRLFLHHLLKKNLDNENKGIAQTVSSKLDLVESILTREKSIEIF